MLDWLDPDGPEIVKAFAATCSAEPRAFGSPSLPIGGVSDGAEGVQWSMEFDTAEQRQRVLVNLEGLAYSGWPTARLILNELESRAYKCGLRRCADHGLVAPRLLAGNCTAAYSGTGYCSDANSAVRPDRGELALRLVLCAWMPRW